MADCQVFRTRARLSPRHSLIGLLIRKMAADERQAESWYLIAVFGILSCSIAAQFLLWSVWHDSISVDRALASRFWFWQCASLVLFGVVGLLGFAAGVEVTITIETLRVRQGQRSCAWQWEKIHSCQIMPALEYYREHAPYVDVLRFMNRIPEDVLLLESGTQRLAIGISPRAHSALHAVVMSRKGKPCTPDLAEVARHEV